MSVNMVVNYDMPWDPVEQKPDVETYLHRSKFSDCMQRRTHRGLANIALLTVGRTGRFGRQGICTFNKPTINLLCALH